MVTEVWCWIQPHVRGIVSNDSGTPAAHVARGSPSLSFPSQFSFRTVRLGRPTSKWSTILDGSRVGKDGLVAGHRKPEAGKRKEGGAGRCAGDTGPGAPPRAVSWPGSVAASQMQPEPSRVETDPVRRPAGEIIGGVALGDGDPCSILSDVRLGEVYFRQP